MKLFVMSVASQLHASLYKEVPCMGTNIQARVSNSTSLDRMNSSLITNIWLSAAQKK